MQLLIDAFRFIALGQLTILLVLLIKSKHKHAYTWTTAFFIISIWAYLLAYWEPINDHKWLFFLLFPFSIALPINFWLFSKSTFDDAFRWTPKLQRWVILLIAIHTCLYLYNAYIWNDLTGDWRILAFLPPYLLSILFALLGIVEAVRNFESDLLVQRQRFRYPFIIISAIVILITLASLMALQHDNLPLEVELLQKLIILSLSIYFSYHQLTLNPNFFGEPKSPESQPQTGARINQDLINALTLQIKQEQVHRKEGLTIRELANIMEVKEYKLRSAINQQLGFKNFNAFINSYRIEDARVMLLENKKEALNITEIAFALGYNSLSPFNKAFKDITGSTPSQFRKDKLKTSE